MPVEEGGERGAESGFTSHPSICASGVEAGPREGRAAMVRRPSSTGFVVTSATLSHSLSRPLSHPLSHPVGHPRGDGVWASLVKRSHTC